MIISLFNFVFVFVGMDVYCVGSMDDGFVVVVVDVVVYDDDVFFFEVDEVIVS